jgi:hypothetical protein
MEPPTAADRDDECRLALEGGERGPGVGAREPGPPREVRLGGGSARREILPGQVVQRIDTRHGRRGPLSPARGGRRATRTSCPCRRGARSSSPRRARRARAGARGAVRPRRCRRRRGRARGPLAWPDPPGAADTCAAKTRSARRSVGASSPSWRCRPADCAPRRAATSARWTRTSAGATNCQVPRRVCIRRNRPASSSAVTAAVVSPVRSATAVTAAPRSCACTAPSAATQAAASPCHAVGTGSTP